MSQCNFNDQYMFFRVFLLCLFVCSYAEITVSLREQTLCSKENSSRMIRGTEAIRRHGCWIFCLPISSVYREAVYIFNKLQLPSLLSIPLQVTVIPKSRVFGFPTEWSDLDVLVWSPHGAIAEYSEYKSSMRLSPGGSFMLTFLPYERKHLCYGYFFYADQLNSNGYLVLCQGTQTIRVFPEWWSILWNSIRFPDVTQSKFYGLSCNLALIFFQVKHGKLLSYPDSVVHSFLRTSTAGLHLDRETVWSFTIWPWRSLEIFASVRGKVLA